MSDVCIIKKLHRYFSPVTLHNGDQLHKGAGTGVEDENLASDSDYFYLKLIVICLNYKNKWVLFFLVDIQNISLSHCMNI